MLGQIVYRAGIRGRVRVERELLCGLPVLRAELDPQSRWAHRRAGKTAQLLLRWGTARVLTPEDFPLWEELERRGVRPVDPLPLIRACGAPLALAALARGGENPMRCAVALRGQRAERDMVRAARELCPGVRALCIAAPAGGEALAKALRQEFGVAPRPDFSAVAAALRFDDGAARTGGAVLSLFGSRPELAGLRISAPDLAQGEETACLPLLEALWETGRLRREALEFT